MRKRVIESTDWLKEGFTSSDCRFLMVTAIAHHRFDSKLWGQGEIHKLQTELAEIDAAGEALLATLRPAPEATALAERVSLLRKGGWVSN